MSIEIDVAGGSKARLLTAGKYCADDIVVTATGGGSATPAEWNDVTFIDYDGAVLYSYSLEEAKALTELPALPSHDGLVCQGWNYDLETIKSYDRPVTIGAMYITDDGKTRIYIHLEEGRTSPVLGCCPNGTVTVDWGDGTEPDILTGADVTAPQWTPNHNYAEPGDYMISLTVDGEMGFYGYYVYYSYYCTGVLNHSSDQVGTDQVYGSSILKVEIGAGVTYIGNYSFAYCTLLESITIPYGVNYIDYDAFTDCRSIKSCTIPNSITSIENYIFYRCHNLVSIAIPDGVTSIGGSAFCDCYSLANIAIPDGVTYIGNNAFQNCDLIKSIIIPESVTYLGQYAFSVCLSISSIIIPKNVTQISSNAFGGCCALKSVIVQSGSTSIADTAFYLCYGIRYFDFTSCTSVPALKNTNAIANIPDDCEMLIPAALYDEWSTATNWATYSSHMVAV